jgi:Raf kinase inhibitor-like YbhB/YbcL family protein
LFNRKPPVFVISGLLALGALTGCAHTLQVAATTPVAKITVASSAFTDGGTIPTDNGCDGSDISPLLYWSGAPGATKSLVFTVIDPDAPGGDFTHWVLYNIPPSVNTLPADAFDKAHSAVDARQGQNDFGHLGYGGPCPPLGQTHRYLFHVYALDTMLPIPDGASLGDVLAGTKGHVIGEGQLMGKYGRQ